MQGHTLIENAKAKNRGHGC